MTPEDYCKEKLIESGSSNYYSFLFLSPEKRKAINSIYAFCQELQTTVNNYTNIEIAQRKLDWWQYEISQAYQHQAQHPVSIALSNTVEKFDLPAEYFQEIIDGRKMDLTMNRYQTFSELSLYCYRVASVVELITSEIFGYQDKLTLKYAHNLGMAFQLTTILNNTKKYAQRKTIYIPQEELQQFSVTENDLLDNTTSINATKLFEHQLNRAQHYFHQALTLLPEQDRYLNCAGIIRSEIYLLLLKKIKKNNYSVLDNNQPITNIRKLWIAWTTARKENKRYQKMLKKKY